MRLGTNRVLLQRRFPTGTDSLAVAPFARNDEPWHLARAERTDRRGQQHSLDGRSLWVADDGDIIATKTDRVIGFTPALADSRYLFELDLRGSRPVRTSTRSGIADPP